MGNLLSRLVDPPALRAFAPSPDLRLALRLCLPAALLAVLLRAWLIAEMPAAFVHNDTSSLIETAHTLADRHVLKIEGKRTFLAPLLACIPALLHIPILPFLAVVQHLLGVVAVFLGGLLVFAWFRHWRWLLVPATLVLALNPVMLWYEHTALAETYALFGILLVALCATAFSRCANRYTFALLLLSVLFMAGARPEGRFFALFAIALILRTLWGKWRLLRVALPLAVVWTAFIFALTRTSQSGLLLLTSVIHLAPEKLAASPGVAEKLADLAAKTRADWASPEPPKLVPLRKEISRRMQELTGSRNLIDPACKRAGLEIVLRNPTPLPGLALRKFLIAHRELPCGDFDTYPVTGQLDALYSNESDLKALRYAPILWGRGFESAHDARAFFETTVRPIPALSAWLRTYVSAGLASLAPLALPGTRADGVPVSGLPWLYACALLGLLTLAFRDPRPLNFHQLWGAFLIGLWILLMVTGNIRARFRVLFEPFWALYALALLDTLLILLSRLRMPHRAT